MVTPQAVATLNDIGTLWKEITNIVNNVIDSGTSKAVNYMCTSSTVGMSWKEITNKENNVIDSDTSNDVNCMCTSSTVGMSWKEITNKENTVNYCKTKTTPSDSPMPDKPLFSGLLIHSFSESKQLVRYNRSKCDTKWSIRVFI